MKHDGDMERGRPHSEGVGEAVLATGERATQLSDVLIYSLISHDDMSVGVSGTLWCLNVADTYFNALTTSSTPKRMESIVTKLPGSDAIGRLWQLTTVQFDFNLPERFGLEYVGEDNKPHRPLMVHRALFGSLERFFGVLIEHYAGAFPLWLAPVQVAVLPVADRFNDYAESVASALRADGLRVEVNDRNDKLNAKIRDAELMKVPFMLILGDREVSGQCVAVRERSKGNVGTMQLNDFKELISRLCSERAV